MFLETRKAYKITKTFSEAQKTQIMAEMHLKIMETILEINEKDSRNRKTMLSKKKTLNIF